MKTAVRMYGPALLNWKLPFAVTLIRVDVPVIVNPLLRPMLSGFEVLVGPVYANSTAMSAGSVRVKPPPSPSFPRAEKTLPVTVVSPLTIRFAVTVLLTLAERTPRVDTLAVRVFDLFTFSV